MRLASIWLKIAAILLSSVPFTLIGLFYLAGGPCPSATAGDPLRLIGFPCLIFAFFLALPNCVLLSFKVKAMGAVFIYSIPIVFLLIMSFSNHIVFEFVVVCFLTIGIICAFLSFIFANKVKHTNLEIYE